MPEAAVAPAPAAAPTPAPAPTPAGAGSLGTVPLGFSNVPTGKAFTRAREALKSGKYDATTTEKEKQPEIKSDKLVEAKVDADPEQQTQPTEPDKSAVKPDEKKKVSPWRLVDEWKEKHGRLEKELSELKGKTPTEDPETAKRIQSFEERATVLEKENAELKTKLQFADYGQSEEYKRNYEQPYHDAWNEGRAAASQLDVTLEDGTVRRATKDDFDGLMEAYLHNPRQAASDIAQLFGAHASIITSHMVDVTKQARRATTALDEFKKTGWKEKQQQQETMQRTHKEVNEHLAKSWAEANKLALEDPKNGVYFKMREKEAADFDPEWNQRLAKGFELADRAFKESPFAPNLTPEQRKSIVQRHAAVRNRAAAFGPLKYENAKLRSQLEEREKALAAYEDSEPTNGEGKGQPAEAAVGGSAIDRAKAALRSGKYSR